uniref:Uncharacterized protein n=1 Tax=Nelumbo nucifera TaxID=4432 RepID=A0A822XJ47_NELNU|nr:TPA_asm: hypothetical protein HUJ06_023007 [Nelumbo nucifera]
MPAALVFGITLSSVFYSIDPSSGRIFLSGPLLSVLDVLSASLGDSLLQKNTSLRNKSNFVFLFFSFLNGEGDNPQLVKTRLRQWAQVVACSVRQSY